MSAQGRPAGRAQVTLGYNDSELQKGLRGAQKRLKNFGNTIDSIGRSFLVAGTAITAPLIGASKVFASAGDELNKMAARTGASVEQLSKLAFAAKQSGTDIGSVEKSISRLQKNTRDLERGLSTSVDAFDAVGLSLKDIEGLSPDELFNTVAQRIAAVEDPTRKAALAMELLGRGGKEIIPLINNMDSLTAEAERLGLVMSTTDAQAAADLTDAFGRLSTTSQFLANVVGAALAPALIDFADNVTVSVAAFRDWIATNSELVRTSLRVGVVLVGVGVSFKALAMSIKLVNAGLVLVSGIVKTYSAVTGLAAGASALLTKSLTAKNAALAVTAVNGKLATGAMKLFAISTKAATLAVLKFVAAPVAVAIGSWKLGAAIADWTGLSKAIEKAYFWLNGVSDLTQDQERANFIKQWDEQLAARKINQDEYNSRVEALNGILKETKKDAKGAADAMDDLADATNNIQSRAESRAGGNLEIDNEKLKLQLLYEGFELRQKEIEIERARLAIMDEGSEREYQAKQEALNIQEQLLNAEIQKADAAERARMADEDRQNVADKFNADWQASMERAERQQSRAEQIENTKLALQYEGFELEEKRLELSKQRAMAEAEAAGDNLDQVRELFRLQEKLMFAREAARLAPEAEAASIRTAGGIVDARALSFGDTQDRRQLEKLDQLVRLDQRRNQILEQGATFN